jgi:hypothetical protein
MTAFFNAEVSAIGNGNETLSSKKPFLSTQARNSGPPA